MADPLLLLAGVLVDGTGGPPLRDAAVLVADGRIAAVGPRSDVPAAGAEVLDFHAHTVIPGLIDGHVHLAWGLANDQAWQAIAGSTAQYSAWALAAVQAAVDVGVTTVRDCGAPEGVTLELRDLVATGVVLASRVLAVGPCLTTTGGHGDFLGVTADSADELRLAIRSLAARRPDAIKVMATGGSMDPHTNRRRAQYTVDELRAVVDEADRFGLHVVAHANATEGIRRSVEAGVRTIAHCNFLATAAGRLDVDPAVVASMLEQGTYVDLNLGAATAPLTRRDARDHDPSDVPADRWELLRGAGLADRVYFSSDGFGPGIAGFPAQLVSVGQHWRLPAEELVWRVTGLAADALEVSDSYGRLSPGLAADLVVLDGDLTADLGALTRVTTVLTAGRRVG
ncbi:amidohydrolase family protein [Tenggerimyces flavus]|uniref:Amidohydrolase family protein n=1 Tax=Tenggerimyces flavus TaxID=1708749 RepID=A0ABV7YE97_9ACTN|nr:amidohydrolase family protein [Tenggerimyces flavus]MBM7786710.1 imidazolonepropionase-like amidohydrolase [Tenggerimyces flavus]